MRLWQEFNGLITYLQCLECDELQDARIPLQEEIDGLRGALDKNESILRYRTESNTARRPVTAAQLSGQKVSSAASRFVEVELPKRAPSAPAGPRQRSPPSPAAGKKKEEKNSSRMEQYFAKTDPTSL